MKLVTFDSGTESGLVGRLDEDVVSELDVPTVRAYFEREGARPTGRRFAPADVRLRAPIVPKKFFHTSGNFAEHREESRRARLSRSIHKGVVFFQNVDAIIGPDEPVVYPEHLTSELDYEIELAVVIGRPGKFLTADQAVDHIAGYVVFNDITARDIQRRELRSGVMSFCKAIDTFCPLGPYVVTADEVPDPHDLRMELRVNGEVRQSSGTDRMVVGIPDLVAHHSPQGYSAGDLITTGSVPGVAAFRPDPHEFYLRPGDVVEAEIDGVGLLRTPIVSWRDFYGEPPPPAVSW